tara:strand:- start:692 stop:862 length:171 start_codon:yes stop_codon:yes gene_type:complete
MSAALCSLVEEALDGACKDMRDQTSTAIDGKTLLNESDIALALPQAAVRKKTSPNW